MIIVQVAGGLGNQLQQYALYRKFVRLGKEARLDISWFEEDVQKNMLAKRELELNYFDRLVYEVCTPEEKAALLGGEGLKGKLYRKLFPGKVRRFTESQIYHPELLEMEDMYICGYFACEKYYGDILYDLREKIQFPKSDNPQNLKLAEDMTACESVSVHVRRGDYLDKENQAMFGNICTDEYYDSALELVKKHCEAPHFYIFSDDAEYVKKKYCGDEYTIVDINHGRDSFYDMWLMSHCKHNICANSTFSFWGARLNPNEDKLMVRPTIHKNSQKFVAEEMKELWQGWNCVSPAGDVY
jgi:hypothetical protein